MAITVFADVISSMMLGHQRMQRWLWRYLFLWFRMLFLRWLPYFEMGVKISRDIVACWELSTVFVRCPRWSAIYDQQLRSILCGIHIYDFRKLSVRDSFCSWWRHQMETFSALLALCAGNSPVTGESASQRPVTQSFDIFFDLCLNKRRSKQSWGWWFEMPLYPLWHHCNILLVYGWVLFRFHTS